MKKNKDVNEIELKVKVSLNLLPFGSIQYEMPGIKQPVEEKEMEIPRYIEPLTTHIENVEISYYREMETYYVPKTTMGI